jgi:predicted dehydrogenase
MVERRLGIIVSGGTGRMGRTQHLPALMVIRSQGGLPLNNGDRLVPDVLLVGRDGERLRALAGMLGIARYTTDLDAALRDPADEVFFDAAVTQTRPMLLSKALQAGKHIYTEKPVAHCVTQGRQILKEVEARGLKHGVVEDKLYRPGIKALRELRDSGFFGRIVKFHIEFGAWVFDGTRIPCQRASWNFRRAQNGGIMLDMFPHWRYLIEDLLGRITRLASAAWTATPERVDERGECYQVDVEDSALCMLTLDNEIHGSISSSWATRTRHDDRFTLHIDGTDGSAEATYRRCFVKRMPLADDSDSLAGNAAGSARETTWSEVPVTAEENSFRKGWEEFLRHVAEDAPLKSDLRAGIRDVQFGVLNRQSARENRWVAFPS